MKDSKIKYDHKIGDIFHFTYKKEYVVGVITGYSENDEYPYDAKYLQIGINDDGELYAEAKDGESWSIGKDDKVIINVLEKLGKEKEVKVTQAIKILIANSKNKNLTKILSKFL